MGRDDSILHVGLPHLPERHPGPSPEVDFRPELCQGDADSVCILLGLFRFFHSVREDHRRDWLQKDNGPGPLHHGPRRVVVYSRR